MADDSDYAVFGDVYARDLVDVAVDPAALEAGGWWSLCVTFEGELRAYRFADVRRVVSHPDTAGFVPVAPDSWTTSLDQRSYEEGVRAIRAHIARGWVYQVNLCRVLSARLPQAFDPLAAYHVLAQGNPAPFAGLLHIAGDQTIISASPELLLKRSGDHLMTGPIKGTAAVLDGLLDKDRDENVMIVDLMRNDLSHIAAPGTVEVTDLLRVENHPGLVHLVSDVECQLAAGMTWADILQAVLPAGSVSGAPKSSALSVIKELEPVSRGAYCGAFGWVDVDRASACLAVGIRTFAIRDDTIRFGTGAGITWGSDPTGEWLETELKARRLMSLMAGQ